MSIASLRAAIPDYAKDIKLNLSSLAREETLSSARLWGSCLAAAIATRQPVVIREVSAEAARRLDPATLSAARTAASLMAMNNVYYRATHLMACRDYAAMPAKLRMNAMAAPGAPMADFELFSLTVSAVNGCGTCLDAHEAALRRAGVAQAEIQTALRVAAVVAAAATVLDAETALPARAPVAA